jgi:glycosyltransferase involved in cell wall biosynthesis
MEALDVDRIEVKIDRSGMNPVADLRLLYDYRRLLRRLRPAAYMSFTIKPNIYGARAAASCGIPAFPNVSGLGTAFIGNGGLQQIVTPLYRWGFRRAAKVFFQNSEDRNLFVERRIVGTARTQVLPGSGVDLDRFTPALMPEGPPTFLLVGRMLRDKGIFEFAEAARHVRRQVPGARFQLLGPVDEGNRTAIGRGQLQEWVRDGTLEYCGTTGDVRPYIAGAWAVALPSYREGLPRSLLEAGAMARPLIATDVPGCRAVVKDGLNGYLCTVRDPLSLANAMIKLAALPAASRFAMGAAARETVAESFGEKRVINAYLEALSDVALSHG